MPARRVQHNRIEPVSGPQSGLLFAGILDMATDSPGGRPTISALSDRQEGYL